MSLKNYSAWSPVQEQLKTRSQDKISGNSSENPDVIFLVSPTDLGVCRNGGRRGASFGPQAILHCFQNMSKHSDSPTYKIHQVAFAQNEAENFQNSQTKSSECIKEIIRNNPKANIIHLGGGHDHVFPYINALEKEDIHIWNLDAHLDTRTDPEPHSGTPFRQLAELRKNQLKLTQIGIQNFSNAPSNFTDLKSSMTVLDMKTLKLESKNFTADPRDYLPRIAQFKEEETLILSLDTDAIDSDSMEAVSAPNPNGLPFTYVEELFTLYRELRGSKKLFIGIYEYNPIFDNLSNKGAKKIASLIYQLLY